jgi:DNA polymerase I-like protein with 3'-5' exonuclease and polymerase domains
MTMRAAVLDIETNLAHDTVWCAVVFDIQTGGSVVSYTPAELTACLQAGNYDRLIGHNLIGFDVPVLSRVWGIEIEQSLVYDTLVAGRLLYPSVERGHSLKEWCKRAQLDELKDEFTDFDGGLSQEMVNYCVQDCKANAELYRWLIYQLGAKGFSEQSILLEHEVCWITSKQERNGFQFDEDGAFSLYNSTVKRMDELEAELQATFPPIIHKRVSEKTGKQLKDRVEVFNPGARQQVAARLSSLGVKWSETTPTGKPKVSETTLKEAGTPEAMLVLEYITEQKKLGLLKAWLNAVGDDGRIHGRVLSNGAVTGRMTHTSPNLAQVPSDPACRSLFKVRDGYKLVGCDASGLELRMLAHYMQDEAYVETILNGDIHTANMEAAGLTNRDQAKTFIYAFLYGAGDAKIGSIVGGGAAQGKALKRKFLASLPALARLIKKLEHITAKATTTDYKGEKITSVPALDGRRVWIRHEHATLNSLLQNAGAVVMKEALVIADGWLRDADLDYQFVANVHDEWQVEVLEQHADRAGQILQDAIQAAGTTLDMRCPLDGEYHVGNNWAETH